MRCLVVASLCAVSLLAADRAAACGGLFCASISPTPVDQSAERILFEVLDDGTVAATVEIKYQGDPAAFSWIVPVGGTPEFVDVQPKELLNLLDAATRPTILPPTLACTNPRRDINFGCTENLAAEAPKGAVDADGGGLDVTEYPSVGPYDDIVVVDGFDPQVLMTWLTDNGYQVTDAMRPYIEQYTLEGYSFLATKLQPNATVRDMVPIRFHCPNPFPEIPLRLTAIAAEPQMGFLVFIAAGERHAPSNYAEIKIAPDQLQTDSQGNTNYFALVSKRIDEEGGQAFVLERAQPSQAARDAVGDTFINVTDPEADAAARTGVLELLGRRPYLTRLYARLDPDEMTVDPQFVPAPGAGRFDGTHDLSSRVVELCPSASEPALAAPLAPSCGLLYCGQGDRCAASDDDGDGCLCDDNRTARAISAPGGGQAVACASVDIDLHGGGAAACADHNCGLGVCVPVNDRPTCSCEEGAVAVIRDGLVTCAPQRSAAFEPDQIVWPTPAPAESVGCALPRGDSAGGGLSVALLLLSPLLFQLGVRAKERWRRRASVATRPAR